jgi:hypothetical protein
LPAWSIVLHPSVVVYMGSCWTVQHRPGKKANSWRSYRLEREKMIKMSIYFSFLIKTLCGMDR